MESFQRKPKGGNSSSTEYARAVESRRAIMLVERIRRIALLFQLRVQLASQFSIFVCVARIVDRHPSGPSGGGKIACTGQFGQIESGATAMQTNPFAKETAIMSLKNLRRNQRRGFFFVFPRTRAFLFSSQEKFLSS